MKRLLASLVVLAGMFGLLPMTSAAQTLDQSCTGAGANSTFCTGVKGGQSQTSNSFYGKDGILSKVANILAVIAGFAAVIAIIVAGIQFILAEGDSGKVRESRNTIIYAIVGLFVILLARSIIAFVLNNWVSS